MTIFALSSGPGISGVAVIRVSGKNTKKVIEEKTASYQKIITNKEKALGDKRITIDNKIKSLSDKAAKKEMAKFEKEITKFYDEVKNKQENLQNKTLEATKKIQDEVLEIIESIAKKKNIAIVTHKANILYYDNSHPVLKTLDKKLES